MGWKLFNSDCNPSYDIQSFGFLDHPYDYTDWTGLQSIQYMTITNHNGKIIFKVISQTNLASFYNLTKKTIKFHLS